MTIDVHTIPPYRVIVENGALNRAGQYISEKLRSGAKILMVSDNNVFPLYGKTLENSIRAAGLVPYRFVFDAGEVSKTTATVNRIYQKLAECGFTRTDAVVNLGGGVAGDMGGFAAATFLRGIAYFQIPTSLLAQVDASVGGKTGVDLPFGKNLVGAFYQPSLVITDPDTLKTLPGKHMRDGMAEVIKYGCICSKSLFDRLADGGEGNMPADMPEIIAECVKYKVQLVEEDTKDTGRRMILNFGHSFGHALEKLQNFSGLLHGEAVGIGMIIASEIGESMEVTPRGTAAEITKILKQYGLPTETDYTAEEMTAATALDKKSDGDMLNFILLPKLGDACIRKMSRHELEAQLKKTRE